MDDHVMWRLVDELIAYQDKRGWNNKEMAERLGVPRTSWSAYRHRTVRPGMSFVHKIAQQHGFGQIARPYLLGKVGVA